MIHNISIATDDDIIQFGDDVNIYPIYFKGNNLRHSIDVVNT